MHITLLTLTRKSELRLAEWKHVNFEASEWLIPAENTKTNAEHIVYLSTQAAEMFRELRLLACGSGYALPGKSSLRKPLHESSLNAALERVTFNIPDFTIHDLRRTASTILHGNHFQPDVIEIALGHKIAGIRGVYNVAEYAAERSTCCNGLAITWTAWSTARTLLLATLVRKGDGLLKPVFDLS